MDFTALQTRVAEETGLDLNNADDLASIKRWINDVYRYVAGLFNWDWVVSDGTVQTLPQITTGTASVSARSTVVTLSTAPALNSSNLSVQDKWMINFPSVSDDWYFISSHTSGSTTIVTNTEFVGTSALVAGSYVLRKVYYDIPNDVDKVIDVRIPASNRALIPIDLRTFDGTLPNPSSTGTPAYYALVGRDSTSWQMTLYPTPTEIANVQIRYYKEVAELVAGTDVPIIPKSQHMILVHGALYFYGHSFIDDDRLTSAKVRYTEILGEMAKNSSHTPDKMTVIRPWDARIAASPRNYRLPDNYGV